MFAIPLAACVSDERPPDACPAGAGAPWITMRVEGEVWPALACSVPGLAEGTTTWVQLAGRSWNVPVAIVGGEACFQVPPGSGSATWFVEGYAPATVSWADAAAGTRGSCGPPALVRGSFATVSGTVGNTSHLPPDTVVHVTGCGGGGLADRDGRYSFPVLPGECVVRVSASGEDTWRGGTSATVAPGVAGTVTANLDLEPGVGLGVGVRAVGDGFVVVEVGEDGAAARAGVVAGDVITEVDGEPTAGMAAEAFTGRARGPGGSQVTLVVQREGRSLRLAVLR